MKNIVLTRIDDRLIHGQVVTAWIKQYPWFDRRLPACRLRR